MWSKSFIFYTLTQVVKSYPVVILIEEDVPFGGDDEGSTLLILFILFISLFGLLLLSSLIYCVIRTHKRISEDVLSREEDNQAYLELDLEEQELYYQSKEFLQANPYLRGDLTLSQNLSIQEKAIKAWEFVKDPMLTNNDLLIVNKCELNFFKNFECSAQTNLPIPQVNEVYYFESKIYSLPKPEETLISIGIGIKPYPWFRLPGRHTQSIAYDSDGFRRHNQPFKFNTESPFPKLIEGDVVGIGYRVRSGTVFFTRNGKKVSELKLGGHIKNFKIPHEGQLYPVIGANNLCSVHVNIGQMGYVFIEGNVKKWGFAPLEGTGPAPPAYNKFNGDILLERSEIDEENDLAERMNDFPPDFWDLQERDGEDYENQDKFSYNIHSDASLDERITLHSLIPNKPPSYDSDLDPPGSIGVGAPWESASIDNAQNCGVDALESENRNDVQVEEIDLDEPNGIVRTEQNADNSKGTSGVVTEEEGE
ncbi:CIC11C00000005862 [Sungouiella intermedia]|uniref:CIC11C00000005862 n=1 Tax=Sungouiella intermedia TaxID=45354 RepID=A0A1L0DYS4_9ASCO|nr:CIC11C00000005862 [[Candida] intermedia]